MAGNTLSQLYAEHVLPRSSRCIRVLEILPAAPSIPDTSNTPIECNIRVIDLDTQPKFTALSYVWGTFAPEPEIVQCGSFQIPVSTNCLSALRQLRKRLGGFTIWVDAVCINQVDNKEKEHQLPLMGEIYSGAESVYIWLGEGTEGTHRAMSFLEQAGLQKFFAQEEGGKFESRPWAASFVLATQMTLPGYQPFPQVKPLYRRILKLDSKKRNMLLNDIRSLLLRPWIHRLWTYQEILLANNPIVVCGDSHLPYSILERSVLFLTTFVDTKTSKIIGPWSGIALGRARLQKESQPSTSNDQKRHATKQYSDFTIQVIKRCRSIFILLATFCASVAAVLLVFTVLNLSDVIKTSYVVGAVLVVLFWVPLIALIMTARNLLLVTKLDVTDAMSKLKTENVLDGLYYREATNPKDMAFGMWAVLQRRGAALPAPSYDDDIGQIYWIFSTRLLAVTKSLEFLAAAAVGQIAGQPSWVPDWSATEKKDVIRLAMIPDRQQRSRFLGQIKLKGRKTGVQSPDFALDETEKVLTVQARKLYTIRHCAKFKLTSAKYENEERESHIDNIRLLLNLTAARSEDKTIFIKEFMYGRSLAPANEHLLEGLADFFKHNHHNSPEDMLNLLLSGGSHKKITYAHMFSELSQEYNYYAHREMLFFYAEKLDESHLLWPGYSSQNIQIGDVVMGIIGVPQPLVVREINVEGKESQISVRIVGPVIWERSMHKKSHVSVGIPLEEEYDKFVKYQIH